MVAAVPIQVDFVEQSPALRRLRRLPKLTPREVEQALEIIVLRARQASYGSLRRALGTRRRGRDVSVGYFNLRLGQTLGAEFGNRRFSRPTRALRNAINEDQYADRLLRRWERKIERGR